MVSWRRIIYLFQCIFAVGLQFTSISTNFWNKCEFISPRTNDTNTTSIVRYTHGLWRECREIHKQTDVECYDNPWTIIEKEPGWSKFVKALAVISCMTIFFAGILSFLQLFTKTILIPSPFFCFMSGAFMLCAVGIYAKNGLYGHRCTNYSFEWSFATGCTGAATACWTSVFGVIVYRKEMNIINAARENMQ